MGWLLRLGVNRGLLGGNRFFATLGAVAAVLKVLQRLSGAGPRTLMTHELKPGEVLVVTDTDVDRPQRSGRRRRSAR